MTSRKEGAATGDIVIAAGYVPGIVGRGVAMHMRYYHAAAGFGLVFEARIAAEMAAFLGRLDKPGNGLWTAQRGKEIVGMIAIDGADGGAPAHLRWFIVDEAVRGSGAGRRLLRAAIDFCDQRKFAQTELWTFEGLDAARHLYLESGFVLAQARPGSRWGKTVLEQRYVRPCGAAGQGR